jgi:hypothetical protein
MTTLLLLQLLLAAMTPSVQFTTTEVVLPVDGSGHGKVTLTVVGTAKTAEGSRAVVVAPARAAVVADPGHGRLLVLAPSQR